MTTLLKVSDLHLMYDVDYPIKMEGLYIIDNNSQSNDSYFNLKYQFRGLVLLLCKQGTLCIRVNNVEYLMSEGATLTILPEMLVEPIEWSKDFRGITFVMSYDFIEKYSILPELSSNKEVLNQLVIYPNQQDNEMIDELSLLIKKYYALPKSLLLEQMIQYLVFSLVTAVSKSYLSLSEKQNLQKNRVNDITDSFFDLLNGYGAVQRNVAFYAAHLHLTPQHLSTLIKKRTGKSAKSWIGYAVINKAKEYLNTTSLSIKQISDKLEFADASLFCRYFKRYIGMTPNEYKNQ